MSNTKRFISLLYSKLKIYRMKNIASKVSQRIQLTSNSYIHLTIQVLPILLCKLLCPNNVIAQSDLSLNTDTLLPKLQWVRNYDASDLNDRSNAIAIDQDGNSYVTGQSDSTGTSRDILTIKYDPFGQVIWQRRWTNQSFVGIDQGVAITLDNNANIFVTGTTQSSISTFEVVTIKYNSQGTEMKSIVSNTGVQSNRDDSGYNLGIDPIGNVFVVGRSNRRAWVFKYSNDLDYLEDRTNYDENPEGFDLISIIEDGLNYFVLVGGGEGGNIRHIDPNTLNETTVYERPSVFEGLVDYDPVSFRLDNSGNIFIYSEAKRAQNPALHPEMFVIQRHLFANSQLTRAFAYNNSAGIYMHSFEIDQDQNLYCVFSQNEQTGKRSTNIWKLTPELYYQIGDEVYPDSIWSRKYFYPSNLGAIPIGLSLNQSDSLQGLYISGNVSSGDIFSLRYNLNGSLVWDTIYTCGINDLGSIMKTDIFGNIFITGKTNCNNSLDDFTTLKYCISSPDKPDSIFGTSIVCVNTSHIYTIPDIPSIELYSWEYPEGWAVEQINRTTLYISFTPNSESDTLKVYAVKNTCPSEPQSLYIQIRTPPASPEAVLGQAEVCSGIIETYETQDDPNADTYSWSYPNGWQGSSDSSSIVLLTGTESGPIVVTAVNLCGDSSAQIDVAVILSPESPEFVELDTVLCLGELAHYEISNQAGVTFNWIYPDSWTQIDLTETTITLIPSDDGVVHAFGVNGMCVSDTQSLYLNVFTVPEAPIVESDDYTCKDSVLVVNITFDDNATNYIWQYPFSWELVDSSLLSLTLKPDTSGLITVSALNICNELSSESQIDLTVFQSHPAEPVEIIGAAEVCFGDIQMYRIESPASDVLEYEWNKPASWSIIGNQNADSIKFDINENEIGTNIRFISATARNTCGSSSPKTISITTTKIDTSLAIISLDSVKANSVIGSFQWLLCTGSNDFEEIPNANLPVFGAENTGEYALKITDNNCVDTSRCVFLEVVSSTDDFHDKLFKISPNPVRERLLVQSNSLDFTDLVIHNSLGKLVEFSSVQESTGTYWIDTRNFLPGIYYLTATINRRYFSKCFVVM
jgi:hypothetical protein